MKGALTPAQLRITALWAFSEAFLGGILHGFKIPFSGLLLASFASICMAALALHNHRKGNILHATVLVLIVKATLSPHTPFTAYFAVSLQGLFGELVFATPLAYSLKCYFNSGFALMQSALQKLIVLTVLFGSDIWTALDSLIESILKQFGFEGSRYITIIVITYLAFYFVTGLFAGWFSSRLKQLTAREYILQRASVDSETGKGRKKSKPVFIIFISIVFLLLIYDYFNPAVQWLPQHKVMQLILRAIIIFFIWYFIFSPLLLKWFRKWLEGKKNAFAEETSTVLTLLPEMKTIVVQSWIASSEQNGIKRLLFFMKRTFSYFISS